MSASSMIKQAEKNLGLRGRPNVITTWYGNTRRHGSYFLKAPWCNMAVTYWAYHSGNYNAVCFGKDYAYTVWHAQEFQRRGRWTYGTAGIAPGDIIFFQWEGGSRSIGKIDHVGIVYKVSSSHVYTIEGNTGDACLRKVRAKNNLICGYGRPAYTSSGSTANTRKDGGFLEMADHVFYRAVEPQKMKKGEENQVHFDHSNVSDNPVVTFAFQNKKVIGDVTLFVKGKGRFGARVVKYLEPKRADLPSGILRPGDTGSDVKKLQEALMKLGEKLPRYGADGDFGSETKKALQAFQSENKLTVDGVYGPNTRAKMESKMGTGAFKLVHRHPDHQFRIDESGESRVSFTIHDQTKDGERMRVTVYPIDEDIEVTRAYVDTWQANR